MTDAMTNWALIAATICVLLSVLQWTDTASWWRDELGANVVLKDICLLFILVPLAVQTWVPLSHQFILWMSFISLSGIALIMLWRLAVMYRIRRPRHDPARLLEWLRALPDRFRRPAE